MTTEECIFDENIHPIDDKQAYVACKISTNQSAYVGINQKKQEFILKLAHYILEVNEEMAMNFLAAYLWENQSLNHEFIFREAQLSSIIAHQGTLAMKFDRLENDEDYFEMASLPETTVIRRESNLSMLEDSEVKNVSYRELMESKEKDLRLKKIELELLQTEINLLEQHRKEK